MQSGQSLYRRLFGKNGIVAYGRAAGPVDHLFVWQAPSGPDGFDTLASLVQAWNLIAPSEGKPARRAILFCQSFAPESLDAALRSDALEGCWGQCAYWTAASFAAGAPQVTIPDGTSGFVRTGEIALVLASGTPPESLDDFLITAVGANLSFKLRGPQPAVWDVDGASAIATPILELNSAKNFVAGAFGVELNWPRTSSDAHPVNRSLFSYTASPSTPPTDDALPVRYWSAQFAEKFKASSTGGPNCLVYLDPRDNKTDSPWVNVASTAVKEFNSRVLCGNAEIHSTLFAPNGSRFVLKAVAGDGAMRFGFRYDMMDSRGVFTSSTGVIFHPEGQFAIVKPDAAATARGTGGGINVFASDLVAGSVTTEFFDTAAATHLEFVKGPALFVEGVASGQAAESLLGDGGGFLRTAHLRFRNTASQIAAPFHSQPTAAALFQDPGGDERQLQRLRRQIGDAGRPMPVFPFAGYVAGEAGDVDGIRKFDTTHLARYRRQTLEPARAGLAAHAQAGDPASLAVTPQGLLARLYPDGSYAALYLGNPDSAVTRDEFSLTISSPANPLFEQVQHALASSQLFMVFRDSPPDVLRIISPSATLYARDFAFSIGPADLALPTAQLRGSVLLVKLFSGKNLDQLVAAPELWALQDKLAPSGNTGIKKLTGLGDKVSKDTKAELKALEAVWFNPEWQGVLALDLPIEFMPDVLESLRPGLALDKTFRAHHFGLNTVRAQKSDLKATSPQRLGSAFGLIDYELDAKNDKVLPPQTADKEPGGSAAQQRAYEFVVRSLQIGFENSQISALRATLNVTFSHLFWDRLKPVGGSNPTIVLDGAYERRVANGVSKDVFSFVTRDPLGAKFDEGFLSKITVSKAQLSVASALRDDKKKLTSLSALVELDATLEFKEDASFPLFTVKEIRVASFGFKFDYAPGPTQRQQSFGFGFVASGMSAIVNFDAGALRSLLSFLPAKIKGMAIAFDDLLDVSDLHYQPLSLPKPLGDSLRTKFQFAFLMELDFGSLGQLAGSLSSMKIPFLLGWSGGANQGLACGIQFGGAGGKLDIGIQQFIRLQADSLKLVNCSKAGQLTAIGIQAVNARVVMLGHRWPESDLSIAIFIPLASNRKASWAFGLKDDPWFVGGGHRIAIDGAGGGTYQQIVKKYQDALGGIGKDPSICSIGVTPDPANDGWAIAAQYAKEFKVGILVADPDLYGIEISFPILGDLDILYRRVDGQLGIFSIEYALPGPIRTIQIGVASDRLPVFRMEIHTDGGWKIDIGYPKNNDYSVSCQVEIGIFVGAGGFYYSKSSALAVDAFQFPGGFGYLPPDPAVLVKLSALSFGFAARVGLGRSFTIGILTGDASITLFGGIEGAAGYRSSESALSPTLFALKGFFGLMVDVQCSVSFAIIQATARLLVYAEVGIELRRVLARDTAGRHHLVTLPVTIFAEVGISVSVTVRIHVGCVSVSISLSFSTVWHFEETLGGLSVSDFDTGQPSVARPALARARAIGLDQARLPATPVWSPAYRYWTANRDIAIYVTVLPCMAEAADVQLNGDYKTCAVGTMMLGVLEDGSANALGDLLRFLLGWLLIPSDRLTGQPSDYDGVVVTQDDVSALRSAMNADPVKFWQGFIAAAATTVAAQFSPKLKLLAKGQDEPFAVIPPWPGSTFLYLPDQQPAVAARVATVQQNGAPSSADDAAFVDFCRHAIGGGLSEISVMLSNIAADQPKSLMWSEIWAKMAAPL